MIAQEAADAFAKEWISAWNSHDMNRIMEHYATDIDFTSPMIVSILERPSGRISGHEELRAYFLKGLAAFPSLTFELYHAIAGVNSVVLYYKSVKNLIAAEVFILDTSGAVKTCICNYKEV